MLNHSDTIAIFAEATMGLINAKMAEGILRYSPNPIAAVIDSKKAGQTVADVTTVKSAVPIVATLDEAIERGATVLVLGTATSGGRIPEEWMSVLQHAVASGLSIVNGMHDSLETALGQQLQPDQFIWDIRTPQGELPPIAMARAATLDNTRVLMVGTDMAVGKMSAGLELTHSLKNNGSDVVFLASGQTGITITGKGIPLDAFRVDHAAGAVEQMVLGARSHDIVVIEGQGSLLHPGSTATLPLMRGSCCNGMILCHRAGMKSLDTLHEVVVPPLHNVIALNESMARAAGALTDSKVRGIALNTAELSETEAQQAIRDIESETDLPVTDPIRYGADVLAQAILAAHNSR